MPPRKTSPKISHKKKLLINADHPEECRAVVLDDGKIEEIVIEHASRELIKGNIYLGVITRVEPAIEAAFVDFGGKKFGFLPFKDVLRESYLPTREKKAKLRIQDVLVRGQKILVQVVKESREAKGPSLTNAITIPGRFLVLMYGSSSTGVSRKIEDETERRKLKEILTDLEFPDNMGVIIRTAGVGRTKSELQKDLQMLLKIWDSIREKLQQEDLQAPVLLYEGPDMVVRTVRDHFTADTSEIIIDNPKSYKAVKEFLRMVMPRMGSRVKLYQETLPLFSAYKVEEQIETIYQRKVLLPSGGSVVFDVGEAMVCVDVNSGKTTSASELEETATRTNLEAANEIARQLRLRDLGGLVVIDFIDMFQKKNKAAVEKQLKLACKNDKARVNISRISRFGLLEMSRQRMSPPLREGVFEPCPMCDATGHVRSASNLALQVIRRIQEKLARESIKVLEATVSTDVANYLLNHKMHFLVEMQEKLGFTVQFKTRDHLPEHEFNYQVLERKRDEEKPREPREEKEVPERRERRGRGYRKPEEPAAAGKEEPADRQEPGKETDEKEGLARGRRKASNGGPRRRSTRRPSASRRTGLQRGRRWRSQRAKTAEGGEETATDPAAGTPETFSPLPLGEDLAPRPMPLAEENQPSPEPAPLEPAPPTPVPANESEDISSSSLSEDPPPTP